MANIIAGIALFGCGFGCGGVFVCCLWALHARKTESNGG